jgi:DNA-binding XRE family transcriptional regulator
MNARWRLVRQPGMPSAGAGDVSLMRRCDSELAGKIKLPLADASTQRAPDLLPVGTVVRVIHATDPWLRRYSGMQARVRQDDGLVVEVLLSCGHPMSLWRNEVAPIAATTDSWGYEGSGSAEPHAFPIRERPVPGFSLQGKRRRAGVTQAAIAKVMGVSVPRISQIEAARAVRTVTAARYLEALRIASPSAA